MKQKHVFSFAFVFLLLQLFFPHTSFGQEAEPELAEGLSEGVALTIPVTPANAKAGQIISFTEEGYTLSKASYDPKLFGVIASEPAVVFDDENKESNEKAVLTSGKAFVLVSSINGTIQKGNLITTSDKPGIGQKATADGFVLGTALEDYLNSNSDQTGSILISLNPGFHSTPAGLHTNLLENLKSNLNAPFLAPGNSLRYFLAAISVLIALVAGMRFFGRVTASGVEALGRNPLAKNAILTGVVLNLVLSLAIMIAGIAIAYLILVL